MVNELNNQTIFSESSFHFMSLSSYVRDEEERVILNTSNREK